MRTKYFYGKRYTYYGTATSGQRATEMAQESKINGWKHNLIDSHGSGSYSIWVRDKE